MRIEIDFVYRPDWTAHAQGLGFGPNGLLGRTRVEVPEIDPDEAPVRYAVRDRDVRIRLLREHGDGWYEPVPKVPQGLGLAALSEMDFRPRKAWDGSWALGFDKDLPLARVELKRLECLSRATARGAAGANPFLVGGGDHRAREREAVAAYREAGIALVGGELCRKVPLPVLVLAACPDGRKALSVSMTPARPAPGQEVLPLDAYDEAVEAVRAAGGAMPARALVEDRAAPAPAPGPR